MNKPYTIKRRDIIIPIGIYRCFENWLLKYCEYFDILSQSAINAYYVRNTNPIPRLAFRLQN